MEFSNMQSQAMASNLDELVLINCPKSHQQQKQQEKNNKPASKPHPEQAIRCPRCDSTSTKFCYYNNYSLSQPRYLCKSCRRYWTQGGSLRNVPFGSSCRKTKRSSSSSSAVATAKTKSQDQHPNDLPGSLILPPFSFDPNDLTLAFFSMQNHENFILPNPIPNPSHSGFLDILRGGLVDNPSESAPSMYCDGFGENATDVGGDRLTVFPSDDSSWQNGLMNPHVGGLHIEDF